MYLKNRATLCAVFPCDRVLFVGAPAVVVPNILVHHTLKILNVAKVQIVAGEELKTQPTSVNTRHKR